MFLARAGFIEFYFYNFSFLKKYLVVIGSIIIYLCPPHFLPGGVLDLKGQLILGGVKGGRKYFNRTTKWNFFGKNVWEFFLVRKNKKTFRFF